MSYQCDIDIDPEQFTNEELTDLTKELLKYRPLSPGNIDECGKVLELPYGFSDDFSSGMIDFAKHTMSTFTYRFIDQEDEVNSLDIEFVAGIKIDD